LTDKGLYPYTSFYLRGVKEKTKKYWSQHFSTIGILGMNEACLNLFKTPLKDNVEFVVNVLNFMKDKILQYQKETGNMYNLESTPAEGCTYRLALLDKKKYPKSICANEETFLKGASPYYTNSTNLPVNYSDDIIDYLEIQDKIQPIYTGGTVHHVYLGETITEEQAKKLVQFISTKFSIPYFTLTPTFTICRNCGYLQGEYTICPKCKTTDLEVFSRIVGYLRPVQTWNEGKQEEFKDRKYMKV
jgi:ribonucleoside-triphosphate reductase